MTKSEQAWADGLADDFNVRMMLFSLRAGYYEMARLYAIEAARAAFRMVPDLRG